MAVEYASPRRYSLATLMAVVAGYMLLFGLTRAFVNFSAGGFFIMTGLFTCVGIGQSLLFGGRRRMRAAVIVGVTYFTIISFGLAASEPGFRVSAPVIIEVMTGSLCAGSIIGAVAATLIDMYILLLGGLLRLLGWRSLERELMLTVLERSEMVKATAHAEAEEPAEPHPLDRE